MTLPTSFSRKILPKQSAPLTLLPQNPVESPSFFASLPHSSTPNTVFLYAQPMPSTKFGNLMELSQPGMNMIAPQLDPSLLANSSHNQLSLGNLLSSTQQTCIQHTFPTNHILSQLNPQILVQSGDKQKNIQLKEKNKNEKDLSTKDKDKDNSKYKKSFQRFGTLKRQQEQEKSESVSLINKKEIAGEPKLKQHPHKDHPAIDLKTTGPDGAKCRSQINQDESKLTSINQNSHSLLNKRNLSNMLETEQKLKFQKIKTSNKRSPLQISPNSLISPETLIDSTTFKAKLEKMEQISPYKKLHTQTPSVQPQAASQIVYSAIPYPQMPLNLVQTGTPNQVIMNPQISYGNPPQSQILIPASMPMSDNKIMAPVMIPGLQAGNFVPNGQYFILMNQPSVMANQPTMMANQPITFNIQNTFNSVPPNYQQAPKIEYITNLYCPNSNNNIFTSDSWLG